MYFTHTADADGSAKASKGANLKLQLVQQFPNYIFAKALVYVSLIRILQSSLHSNPNRLPLSMTTAFPLDSCTKQLLPRSQRAPHDSVTV